MQNKKTYIGIDETTLGLNHSSIIICAAVTNNCELTKYQGYNQLPKSGQLLKMYDAGENVEFPTYRKMQEDGLTDFHWIRSNRGKLFNRQEVAHASIADLILAKDYNPKNTFLFIDTFEGNLELSKSILMKSLHKKGFLIPRKNIDFHDGGDSSVPIINYADHLAFQIGLWILDQYKQYMTHLDEFPIGYHELPFDSNRVEAIDKSTRDDLSDIIRKCKRL